MITLSQPMISKIKNIVLNNQATKHETYNARIASLFFNKYHFDLKSEDHAAWLNSDSFATDHLTENEGLVLAYAIEFLCMNGAMNMDCYSATNAACRIMDDMKEKGFDMDDSAVKHITFSLHNAFTEEVSDKMKSIFRNN